MAAIQKNRKIQVFTPLKENTLLFYRMHGSEQLSEPFLYNLELLSESATINPETLLGESVTIGLELDNNQWRYFNGFVSRFGQYGNQGGYHHYRAEVRPWLWFLTRASNCRIFQNQTAPDIIKQVFRDQGFTDFESKLNASYSNREYCVQYRETDFNFVSRLMEEEGIYYYFSHDKGKHTLVLVDDNNTHVEFPGYQKIPYFAELRADLARVDHIHEWGFNREVQPGAYELTDYDFKKPKANLKVKSQLKESHSHSEREFFDYPGRYTETGAGDNYVRQRIEEQHARFERCEGQANARGLSVGYAFKLQDHPRDDQNKKYLVVSAEYHLKLDEYFSNSTAGEPEQPYTCSFTALDNARPFRPGRSSLKPLVHGAQTAVVVGPSGDEIYTDQYGRVKVQFHWDRYGKKDQDSSCWVRVAHPWAGKNWGMIAIPRIGHEVVIEFLEGDPDQPLIIGSVYNADMMPPYALPANATQTGIKSRSSKGAGSDNFNEIRLEDKKGSEEMYIHAEKDQNSIVENDQTITVGNDRQELIKRDRSLEVDRDKSEKVVRNKAIEVVGSHTEQIHGAMTITVGSTLTESVLINYAETVGGAMELTVGAALAITVGAAMAETVAGTKAESVGANKSENIGGGKALTITKNLSETVGQDRIIKVGKNVKEEIKEQYDGQVGKSYILRAKKIQLTAEDEITFKTGDASIVMKKNGDIQLKGKKIKIEGSGDVIVKGSKIKEN